MGNYSSKKSLTLNDLFPMYELILKDRKAYDEGEHLNHALIKEIFKGNFSSPIQDVLLKSKTKVLDVGCGSGFWLMEMAADFQKPKYIGVDILPVFPKSTFPNNVEFFQCNLLEGLPYEDNTFDFIHMQLLASEFTESQWENFIYQEITRVLKPGGWLEFCDPDFMPVNAGPATKKTVSAVCNYLTSKNANPRFFERHGSLLKLIPSFSSSTVHHEGSALPLTDSNENKIGKLGGLHIKETYKLILQGPVGKSMNIKQKDLDSFVNKLANEFELRQTYFNVHRFYVQKRITK